MKRPSTSHLSPRHRRPDTHEGDYLFEGVGENDPLIEALYRTSLMRRLDVDAIDHALDAHLAAHGDPEQQAFAKQACAGYDRLFPLAEVSEGSPLYLQEHQAWNPQTDRERAWIAGEHHRAS